jgi:hypothetical protein
MSDVRTRRSTWHRLSAAVPVVLMLVCVLGLSAPAATREPVLAEPVGPADEQPGGTSLVLVPITYPGRAAEAAAAGLVPYQEYFGSDGRYLLAGMPSGVDVPFPVRVLDPSTAGAAYYSVYSPPQRPHPDWAGYGELLINEGTRTLLRTTESNAELLAEQGVELARIKTAPMALAPPAPRGLEVLPAALTPDPAIQDMIDRVSSATVVNYTAQLSGEKPAIIGGQPYTITTRHTSSGTPIQKATHFVGEHLAGLGYTVEYQQWLDATNPNVIGERTGQANPGDIFLMGGHLDDMPGNGVAPGADDNASGSVGALIMADIASEYDWGCTLRFVFWTGEEQGMEGSDAYASRAKGRNENIRGYLNLDMISYNSSDPRELNLFTRSTVSGSEEIADLFVDVVSTYDLDLVPVKYVNDFTGDYSDNSSFWRQGYPAILAIEDDHGDFNPAYHTANDRLAGADLDYYTEFVKAAVGTFAHMTGCLISSTPTATATPTSTPTSTSTATPTSTPMRIPASAYLPLVSR